MVPLQGVNSPSRIGFNWHPDWKVLVEFGTFLCQRKFGCETSELRTFKNAQSIIDS